MSDFELLEFELSEFELSAFELSKFDLSEFELSSLNCPNLSCRNFNCQNLSCPNCRNLNYRAPEKNCFVFYENEIDSAKIKTPTKVTFLRLIKLATNLRIFNRL